MRCRSSPYVRTAITTMHLTPARPMDSTGRDISTTASSWAWAHGLAGVMATAGAAIGSVTAVAEAIAEAAGPWPNAAALQAAAEQFAPAAAAPTVRMQAGRTAERRVG